MNGLSLPASEHLPLSRSLQVIIDSAHGRLAGVSLGTVLYFTICAEVIAHHLEGLASWMTPHFRS